MKYHIGNIGAAHVDFIIGGTCVNLIENGSFENDLSGWTTHFDGGQSGNATIVSSISSLQNPPAGGNIPAYLWYPVEGTHFLALGTGAASAGAWQTVTQTITVPEGQVIYGWAAFDWNGSWPNADGGRVRIYQGATTAGAVVDTPFYMDGESLLPPANTVPVPDYYNGQWTYWKTTPLPAGTYTIELGVVNTIDTGNAAFCYFDRITTCPIPISLNCTDPIINGSFENGMTGWDPFPFGNYGSMVSSHLAPAYMLADGSSEIPAYTYFPITQEYFLKLESGSFSSGEWHTKRQTVTLQIGQVISGKAAFVWGDNDPFYDGGRVRILKNGVEIATPWFMDGNSFPNTMQSPYDLATTGIYVNNFAYSLWQYWEWMCPQDGDYTIELGIVNESPVGYEDAAGCSYALFDDIKVNCPTCINPFVNPNFSLPGGFSGGSFDGWTDNMVAGGGANVVDLWISTNDPASGSGASPYRAPGVDIYFAVLSSSFADMNVWQTISQTVTLKAGMILSGYAAFDWNDGGIHKDGARVRIYQGATVMSTPFLKDGTSLENYANTQWQPWVWTCPADGTYTLEFGVVNTADTNNSSEGLFSGVIVTCP